MCYHVHILGVNHALMCRSCITLSPFTACLDCHATALWCVRESNSLAPPLCCRSCTASWWSRFWMYCTTLGSTGRTVCSTGARCTAMCTTSTTSVCFAGSPGLVACVGASTRFLARHARFLGWHGRAHHHELQKWLGFDPRVHRV
jgi:hypothetical protein